MDILFIETPEFIKKIDRLVTLDEIFKLQEELIKDPYRGKIVPGTGGARKIRMKIKG